jgi:hypothetical protein
MTSYPLPRRHPSALLAIAAVHALLVGAFLSQRPYQPARDSGNRLEAIQWLLPMTRPPAAPEVQRPPAIPLPARRPVKDAPPVNKAAPAAPAMPITPATPVAPAAPSTPEPPAAPAADPFSQPAQPTKEALLRGHDWGAGKADHELRGGKLAKLVPPTDTLQAGLEKAFRDAGEAVPPKWFNAPEIKEISVPESRMRVYKIRTALGTYCFYKPDASRETYTYALMLCPREKK